MFFLLPMAEILSSEKLKKKNVSEMRISFSSLATVAELIAGALPGADLAFRVTPLERWDVTSSSMYIAHSVQRPKDQS
jgi:hypothetical protein